MPCILDDSSSPDFSRQRDRLSKRYPNIEKDLVRLYEEIAKDYKRVPNGHGVPGHANLVWKYRCDSTDMDRGKSGSFRVLAYYREQNNTMYMFCVYGKKDYEKEPGQQPPARDIKKWIKNVLVAVNSPAEESAKPAE